MQQPPDFVPETQPSPTSTLGINLRFYHITSETGQDVYWDLGAVGETILENGYDPTQGSVTEYAASARSAMSETLKHGVHFMPTIFFSVLVTGSTAIYDGTIAAHERILKGMLGAIPNLVPKPKTEPPAFEFKTASW